MFDEMPSTASILALGIGNSLLGDDGIGIRLVSLLSKMSKYWGEEVELMDGGTQGMALLGHIPGRDAIVLLDAVSLGAEPGKVHVLRDEAVLRLGFRSSSAHEGNAGELLRAAQLLGDLPKRLVLVGIEPGKIATGISLSDRVEQSLPSALAEAVSIIDSLLEAGGRAQPVWSGRRPAAHIPLDR